MTKSLLTPQVLEALSQYRYLYVAFSGGLDSTVLLHYLAQQSCLTSKIKAIHVNHGLSANALFWQKHCHQFCQQLAVSFTAVEVDIKQQVNLEQEARLARYAALQQFITSKDCLLTAHHRNDQAETLLLQLIRGAGIDGLAGMGIMKVFGQGQLLRPFLSHSRQKLENYALAQQLTWIEDESNADISFTRNFLRHRILPLLQEKWPTINRNLLRTSQHCQQAQANLYDLALIDCPALLECSSVLSLLPLRKLSQERLTNVLRYWLHKNNIRFPNTETFQRLIDEVVHAQPSATPEVQWSGVKVKRYQQTLYLLSKYFIELPSSIPWSTFPQALIVEGLGRLETKLSQQGIKIVGGNQLEVRFRQEGEIFYWKGQKKPLKKLMQQWQIPVWLRSRIPLLYIDDQLAMIVGYAISDHFYTQKPNQAFHINLH